MNSREVCSRVTRVSFLLLLMVSLVGLACGVEPVGDSGSRSEGFREEPQAEGAPNVVLISLDTFRADRLQQAPFISELGRKGWRSTQVRSNSNWTLPAHVSLFTSSPPVGHEVPGIGSRLPYPGERIPQRLTTLAEAFQAAGYYTAATTDGGFLIPRFGIGRGFDAFRAEDTSEGADSFLRHKEVLARMLAERGDRPFFLFVHSYEIHDYFLNTEPYHRFVDEEADRDEIAHGSWLAEIQDGTAPREYVSRLYDSGIRWVDEFVEELIAAVEAGSAGEDLLVVITSDHGESFGTRPGLWHHGEGLWEEQLRVPLVVWGNYATAPQGLSDLPASLMDVAPSVLAASGVDVPSSFEGRSDLFEASGVASAARVGGSPWRIEADRVRTGESWRSSYLSAALIEEGWKYFRKDSFEGQTREQVCFDLRSDPGEQENRMGDPATPCSSLARKLALRWSESPAWALSVTSAGKDSIGLELEDSASLLGVRSRVGSGGSIAQRQAGTFQWLARGSEDQLALLLAREPAGEIRVTLGSGRSVYRLEWSDLETAGGSLELGAGTERVVISVVGAKKGPIPEPEDDREMLEQLKALGYAE